MGRLTGMLLFLRLVELMLSTSNVDDALDVLDAAQAAVQLDADLSLGSTSLGILHLISLDNRAPLAAFFRAIARDQTDSLPDWDRS